MALLYNPSPAFSTKISQFLRNRGRWFRISTSFSPQTSSFGDICILPPFEICTRSTRTSWSCTRTPWSQFFYSNIFNFISLLCSWGFWGLCRVFTFEGVCRVFTLRVYVGIYFEGVCRVFTLRVYVGIYFEGVCRVFTLRVYINRCIFSNSSAKKGR